jgi:CubicO group peptidase (beta-lactamase class C family)
MKSIYLFIVSAFVLQTSYAQSWQDTLNLIDKSFSQYQANQPGIQLSISRNGNTLLNKAWGMADLERNTPLSTVSILESGSVAKQFVAASILLLEQQGKLSIDDDVRKYVPELPVYETPISIRQMLHHTSGFRDWGSIAELTGWPRGKKFYTNDDVLDIVAHQKSLNNIPGGEYIYSNTNYNLMALIVHRLSGLSLAAFTKQYIFEPAGMTHSEWREDPNKIVPNRAIAYTKTAAGFETNMPNEYVYGQGGMLTTAEDLLKWNDFYLSGKLGTSSLLAKQTNIDRLNNGAVNTYAAGLIVRKVNGFNNISHSGATASYRAYLEAFPDLHLSIAILSNTSQYNISDIATKVRNIFVPDKTVKVATKETTVNLTETQLSSVTGMYKNERDASSFELSVKNNQLVYDKDLKLTPVSENSFRAPNFLLEIKGSKGLYISFSPRDTVFITKVLPAKNSGNSINTFIGIYTSEETNSNMSVKQINGNLVLHVKPGQDYSMIPTYIDAFKVKELGADILFIRNNQNNIVTMNMSVSRARNVAFKKMINCNKQLE